MLMFIDKSCRRNGRFCVGHKDDLISLDLTTVAVFLSHGAAKPPHIFDV